MPLRSSAKPSFAKAIYNNEADTVDELSFHRGDILTVLEKHPDEWWLCSLRGRTGVAPANRLRLLGADKASLAPSKHESTTTEPTCSNFDDAIIQLQRVSAFVDVNTSDGQRIGVSARPQSADIGRCVRSQIDSILSTLADTSQTLLTELRSSGPTDRVVSLSSELLVATHKILFIADKTLGKVDDVSLLEASGNFVEGMKRYQPRGPPDKSLITVVNLLVSAANSFISNQL